MTQFVDQLAANQKTSGQHVAKDFFEHRRPTPIIKRLETPEEIDAVAAFVASPLASGIDSAALRVDGGVVGSIG